MDPRSPLVFHETHRRPPAGMWTHVSLVGELQVVARHRVANIDVKDHVEHSQDERHLHLHAMVCAQLAHQVGSTAIPGTQVPRASKS